MTALRYAYGVSAVPVRLSVNRSLVFRLSAHEHYCIRKAKAYGSASNKQRSNTFAQEDGKIDVLSGICTGLQPTLGLVACEKI